MSDTILTNDPSTTLASPMDAAQTSLVVSNGFSFPPSGYFHIRIDDEIMRVNAVSGNTWGVDRAWEFVNGVKAAATHATAAPIYGVFTVDAMTSGGAPADYINPVMTLDQYGRIKAAANGTNRFFSATGVPDPAIGLVGDYYIDIATSIVYQKS